MSQLTRLGGLLLYGSQVGWAAYLSEKASRIHPLPPFLSLLIERERKGFNISSAEDVTFAGFHRGRSVVLSVVDGIA